MQECVLERVRQNAPIEDSIICPYLDGMRLNLQKNKVCGADIHKRFLIATTLSKDGQKETRRFRMDIEDLVEFRVWVTENECEQVAIESTGAYWYPVQTALEGSVDLIVAHPYKIKHIPGRKTDIGDSEWIAELCLNGLIEPSRIFPKEDRELRRLTRAPSCKLRRRVFRPRYSPPVTCYRCRGRLACPVDTLWCKLWLPAHLTDRSQGNRYQQILCNLILGIDGVTINHADYDTIGFGWPC